jgi:hypothetical protein
MQRNKRHIRYDRRELMILGTGLKIVTLESDLDLLADHDRPSTGCGDGTLLRSRREVHSQVYSCRDRF